MNERIEPMPEEIASGHEGRMALFMGARDHQEFDKWLKQKLTRIDPTQVGMSRLAQLAAACEMPTVDYAKQHSLLGVLRAVARTQHLGEHGSPHGEAFTRRMGTVNQKDAAYLCPHCVEEDIKDWKFSWFRRSHHLLGVDWCPSHKTPLLRVAAKAPWSNLPQFWVQKGDVEPGSSSEDKSGMSSFEERLSEIACTLLRSNCPIDINRVREVLVARANGFNLRTCATGARPLVSDMVWKRAPKQWLDRHWPEMKTKSTGLFVNAIDKGVAQSNVPISGFGYMTIFAALWNTDEEVSEVLRKLAHVDLQVQPRERMIVKKKGEAFWHGDFYNLYVESGGRINVMTEQLGVDVSTVRSRMIQIGLPALKDLGAANWRAYLRFEAGEALSEACAAECAELSKVELLIRQSCARVAHAAKTVISNQQNASGATHAKKARLYELKTQSKSRPEQVAVG